MSKNLQQMIAIKEAEIAAAKLIAEAVEKATELLSKAGVETPMDSITEIWDAL